MRDDTLELAKRLHANGEDMHTVIYQSLSNERKHTIAGKLCRLRHHLIWFGGWEKANCLGWRFKGDPFPLTIAGFMGGGLTIFGHWLNVRIPSTWLVVNFRERYAYVSPDGTPQGATRWLYGRRGIYA